MSQPAIVVSAAQTLRRAFDWWLAQLQHVLPPTIFFFIGFNLILVPIRRGPLDSQLADFNASGASGRLYRS